MKRLDLLESHDRLIFYSLQHHEFTLFPGIPTQDISSFLNKTSDINWLLVSDDLELSHDLEVPYQTSVYDPRFNVNGGQNAWITYELAVFLITEDVGFLNNFDFVVLDEIDSRRVESDLLLGLITNLKINGKFVIPLASNFKIDVYETYLKSFDYDTCVLDLIRTPSVKTFHVNTSPKPQSINKQILETINQIFQTDPTTQEFYDILIILNNKSKCKELIEFIREHSTTSNFSIITNISEYQIKGLNRRLIVHTGSKEFLKLNHRIKYIIDLGTIDVQIDDTNLLPIMVPKPTNKNRVHSHLSVLEKEGCEYFCFENIKQLNDFEYGVNDSHFIPHLLYVLKNGVRLYDLKLLKPPKQETLERSISYLVYLGFVSVSGNEVNLTEFGELLMRFQVGLSLKSLSLFALLIDSIGNRCTKEMLKIVSLLLTLDWNKLSIYLKEHKVRAISSENNDFITILNIFDSIIHDESVKAHHLTMTFNEFFDKDSKRRILEVFRKLRSTLNKPVNFDNAEDDNINRTLFKSFQLHCGSLILSPSNDDSISLFAKPIIDFTLVSQVQFFIKKVSFNEHDQHSNNEIIIFSDCEYCLINSSIFLLTDLVSDDLSESRDSGLNHINFSSKIPKRIVKEVGSPLYKWA